MIKDPFQDLGSLGNSARAGTFLEVPVTPGSQLFVIELGGQFTAMPPASPDLMQIHHPRQHGLATEK